jgi:hypothetical protein
VGGISSTSLSLEISIAHRFHGQQQGSFGDESPPLVQPWRCATFPLVIISLHPKSVGRVGSRLHGFPCFPYSFISMACFSRGKCWISKIFRHSGFTVAFKTTFEVFTRVGPDDSLERLTERSVGLVTDQPSDVYELFVTLLE